MYGGSVKVIGYGILISTASVGPFLVASGALYIVGREKDAWMLLGCAGIMGRVIFAGTAFFRSFQHQFNM